MERLQAAIEKAREKRTSDETVVREGVGARNRDAAPSSAIDEAWEALPLQEISDRHARRNRLFLEPGKQQTIYFDRLRTKVLQICRDNGWRRIVVTSATAGCGKTTVSCNLAASFTRQRDRRVVALDLDMRRPGMAKVLGHRASEGFSEVLEDRVDFGSCAFRLGPSVAVCANQRQHPNPAQLLLQDRTPEILDELQERYAPDLMVFDTPPLLAADDTVAFLKHVDCALIVAAAESSTTEDVDMAEKEVAEQTNVLGIVLNKCVYMDETSGGYYDYR